MIIEVGLIHHLLLLLVEINDHLLADLHRTDVDYLARYRSEYLPADATYLVYVDLSGRCPTLLLNKVDCSVGLIAVVALVSVGLESLLHQKCELHAIMHAVGLVVLLLLRIQLFLLPLHLRLYSLQNVRLLAVLTHLGEAYLLGPYRANVALLLFRLL